MRGSKTGSGMSRCQKSPSNRNICVFITSLMVAQICLADVSAIKTSKKVLDDQAKNPSASISWVEEFRKLPVSVNASLSNSVGIGTFVAGYRKMPSWSSTLSLSPSYKVPVFLGLPKSSVSASIGLDVSWLQSYATSGQVAKRQVRVSDVGLGWSMPKAIHFESIDVALSPKLGATLPISIMSRAQNRVMGFSGGLSIGWAASDFSASWSPSASGWLHSGAMRTFSCRAVSNPYNDGEVALPPVINPNDPDANIEDYMLPSVAYRDEESGLDGRCIIAGRQTLASLKNAFDFAWAPGAHRINLGFGIYHSFLRGLSDAPELRSSNASGQNFRESTMGRISYSYRLPVEFDASVSVGLSSYQPIYDKRGNIRLPFFDFFSASNNFTQMFVNISAGI